MRRVYHPYWDWEDYQAGMFALSAQPEVHRGCARCLLSDPPLLLDGMRAAVDAWPVAAEHNLTAVADNRQAWLGAAACCHHCGAPEHTTRDAWWSLTDSQKVAANAVADVVIVEYEQARCGVWPLFPVSWLAVGGVGLDA